jgi:glycosyltransferase involved in cell wall biosynthesis
MSRTDPLVSIGLPVRNGAATLATVIGSVLSQEYDHWELVISDNASTDDTEEVGRSAARSDPRIRYHRQPENIGLLNNFLTTAQLAGGEYFRWIGDSDWIAPQYLTRLLDVYAHDDRLILVTSRLEYELESGERASAPYHGTELAADDPSVRFVEMLRLLNDSYLTIDPMYGLFRRSALLSVPRRNMMREDQIFAARYALAGPWAHVNDLLAGRGWTDDRRPQLARRLGVPAWQARMATVHQCRELLRSLDEADLEPAQRRRARAAIGRLYLGRKRRVVVHGSRRLARLASRAVGSR